MSQSLNIFYGGQSGRILSELYQYAWSLGLKTTYYLRTMGASRIEKSTVNLAKFGATSNTDSPVGITASTVIIEETVAVLPRQPHEEPAMMAEPSPQALMADVVASLEHKQVEAGQMTMPTLVPVAIPAQPQMVPNMPSPQTDPRGSAGVPSFGEKVAVKNRPKIEIIGEACESCSA